ncbi:polymer-forming cytoskeletal protein [Patescibacteria group bacterium]|nr:polymer-forming cytoskeletal protein [Patescibacteria group bacterium]
MSKERKDFADPNQFDTLVGKEVVVKGTLESEGDVQINGYFAGTIDSEKDVIVSEHAKVKANITGKNVYVAGEVDGDITASEKLEILETGRVDGDVTSQALSIEPGGILKGSSQMRETESEKPNSTPTFEVEEETK